MTPQIQGVIFFLATRQVCQDKESLSRQKSSIARTSLSCSCPSLIMCVPRALSLRLCHARIPVAHACLSCVPGSIVGDRASLSCTAGRLCCVRCAPVVHAWPYLSRAPGLACHALSLPMPNSVVGEITFYCGQLFRDLKILYRDINSPYSGQLCRNIELLCRDRKLLA